MKSCLALLVLVPSLAYAQSSSPASDARDDSARAANAAERAALAAQQAAEAASRAAAAAERIAASVAPAAAAAAPAAPKTADWSGSVGFGLISLTGNARTLTLNGTGLAERKSEHWIFGIKASSLYGQTRPAGSDEQEKVLALAAALQLRADRRLSEALSVYVTGGVDTDHVKSIEWRGFGEVGVGLIWFDTKDPGGEYQKTFFRTDLAMRHAREYRFQYFPVEEQLEDITLTGPRLGITFRYGLTKDSIFIQEAELLPNIVGDSRLIVNTLSKLSARLTKSVSLGVSFAVKYDSSPAVGKQTTDTALTVGVEVGF